MRGGPLCRRASSLHTCTRAHVQNLSHVHKHPYAHPHISKKCIEVVVLRNEHHFLYRTDPSLIFRRMSLPAMAPLLSESLIENATFIILMIGRVTSCLEELPVAVANTAAPCFAEQAVNETLLNTALALPFQCVLLPRRDRLIAPP